MTFTESLGIGVGIGLGFVAVAGLAGALAAWRLHLWTQKIMGQGQAFMEKALPGIAASMPRIPTPPLAEVCPTGCLCQACYDRRHAGYSQCSVCGHLLISTVSG